MAMAMAAASTTFKHLPIFFCFFILLISSVQIEARANRFFSKFIHTDHNVAIPEAPEISPIFPPTPAPAPFIDESQNAYGLYGNEGSRTITDVEEEILAEDDDGDESYKSGYPKTNPHSDSYGKSPRKYEQYHSNYENGNGYRNYQYQSNYENGNGGGNYQYQSNFEDDGYRRSRSEPTEREGMSDTRFVENGRYYHDVNSRNGGEEDGDSYGSKKNPNEFDSMEEYEKSEGFLP